MGPSLKISIKFLVTLSTVVVFLSCSGPNTSYKNLNLYTLDKLGISLKLPASFQEMTLDDEVIAREQSDDPEELIVQKLKFLDWLRDNEENGFPTQYFVDSLSLINDIRFMAVPGRLKIGQYMSRELFLYLDGKMQEQGKALSMYFQPLENVYFHLENGVDVMKIRYRAYPLHINQASIVSTTGSENPESRFATFYLVQTTARSFTIMVNHMSEDFEYFIRTISPIESKD